jgi:hypothetical protein
MKTPRRLHSVLFIGIFSTIIVNAQSTKSQKQNSKEEVKKNVIVAPNPKEIAKPVKGNTTPKPQVINKPTNQVPAINDNSINFIDKPRQISSVEIKPKGAVKPKPQNALDTLLQSSVPVVDVVTPAADTTKLLALTNYTSKEIVGIGYSRIDTKEGEKAIENAIKRATLYAELNIVKSLGELNLLRNIDINSVYEESQIKATIKGRFEPVRKNKFGGAYYDTIQDSVISSDGSYVKYTTLQIAFKYNYDDFLKEKIIEKEKKAEINLDKEIVNPKSTIKPSIRRENKSEENKDLAINVDGKSFVLRDSQGKNFNQLTEFIQIKDESGKVIFDSKNAKGKFEKLRRTANQVKSGNINNEVIEVIQESAGVFKLSTAIDKINDPEKREKMNNRIQGFKNIINTAAVVGAAVTIFFPPAIVVSGPLAAGAAITNLVTNNKE